MSAASPVRLVVAITGASGAIYGVRLLEVVRGLPGVESHLVVTKAGERTIVEETDRTPRDVRALAHAVHRPEDIGAPIASGSFATAGMIVAPCSIHTLSQIAYCLADTLVGRAADVTLKERRRLVLLVRETPLHRGHLAAMLAATEAGAIVMPPVPAFYTRPASLADVVDHTVGRALALVGLESGLVTPWTGGLGARERSGS
ncbi:MAG TPA: UbiX family flavin prenyltransferase [Thermodesulfobacteriota bacterium]